MSVDIGRELAALTPRQRAIVAERLREARVGADVKTVTLPTLQVVARRDPLPLSFAQQRLWFLDQLDPGSAHYNLSDVIHLKGPLDVATLERSLNEVVRRHEVLRTSFTTVEGAPVQVIAPALRLSLDIVGLEHLAPDEREGACRRMCAAEAKRPFDLGQSPLFRVRLVRVRDDKHVLLLIQHHIISDAWSMGLFVHELMTLYEAFSDNRLSPLPENPLQYGDYAVWQRRLLQGDVLEGQLAYWRTRLSGELAALEVRGTRSRSTGHTHAGANHELSISPGLARALRNVSRREGVTLFMVLLGAFSVLLYRYTGQKDILVGAPIAGRNRAELESLIGFFVNTLVLRTDLSGNPTVRELLKRVREVSVGAYAHQDLPFEKIVEALNPPRRIGRTPLFQVMLSLQNVAERRWRCANIEVTAEAVDNGAARFDLTLALTETGDGLHGVLNYDAERFDARAADRMANHFHALLHAIVASPDARIDELPLIGESERRRLLVEWNETLPTPSAQVRLHELIEAQAAHTPNQVAVVFEDQELTYVELNRRANQLARYLRSLGVEAEAPVGLFLPRGVQWMVAVLGTLKAGGAYVPIDVDCPPGRIGYMLRNAGIAVVLTEAAFLPQWTVKGVRVICLDDDSRDVAGQSGENLGGTSDPANLAYIIYTSGSTGGPKGVAVEHRQIVNYVTAIQQRLALPPGARYAAVSTVAADLGNTVIFAALASGGTLHMISADRASNADALADYFARTRIDCLKIVPSHLTGLQATGAHVMPEQLLVVGGEASSWPWVTRWQQANPACRILNHYGPTETTVGVLGYDVPPAGGDAPGGVPLGRPFGHARTYVLDGEMEPVPIGIPGELYIGGPGLARGYVHQAGQTAERFVPDPFGSSPGARLYRTGDRVSYLDDGNLEFLGRVDQQVKVRGYRIELAEIEAALREHPGIVHALATTKDGVQGLQLIAYVVGRTGDDQLTASELRRHLLEYVPDYMVPAVFVMLGDMPLTTNGKIDVRALPVPLDVAKESFVGARNETEETLCRIWADILGVERVGIDDNFFERGGDSILSIQVLARAARRGVRLTVKQLFQHQNIRELAAVAGTAEDVVIDQGRVTGPVPLTPIQRWFFERHLTAWHHYNQSALVEPREPLDFPLLQEAVGHLLHHHDALSFRYVHEDGGWRQMPGEAPASCCERVDLSHLAGTDQAEALCACADERQSSLDVSAGPLIRVVLFDRGQGVSQRLLLIIHHLVVDGVSWRILLDDLQTAYRQVRSRDPVRLPAKTMSYQDWAVRLWAYREQPEPRRELMSWLAGRGDAPSALPFDGPGGANTVGSAREVVVELSREETRALLQDVPKVYNTRIDDVLVTALVQAYARWTRDAHCWLTLEGHGREFITEHVDVSRTVGWFTSMHPVRFDLREISTQGAALTHVKAQLRGVPCRGLGWGLWRYSAAIDDTTARLRTRPEPALSYNYLGQFDQTFGADSLFRDTLDAHGRRRHPDDLRACPIEVSAIVRNGELRIVWTFSDRLHLPETISRVANWHLQAIRDLITHCRSSALGGFTPADLPGARISEHDLAILTRAVLA